MKGLLHGIILVVLKLAAVQATLADGGPSGSSGCPALRKELRAFYPPGYCRLECQAPEQTNSVAEIRRELEAWCAAHPAFEALDVRRESYLAMRRHFVPFVFTRFHGVCFE